MKIKNVRKPTKKESKIVPLVILLSMTTAIITALAYFTHFYRFDVGQSMYLAKNIWSGKSIATHNLVVQLFEAIYGRDYMLSKLEALPISLGLSVVSEALTGIVYSGYKYFGEGKKSL